MATFVAPKWETFLPAAFTAPGLSEADFLALCDDFPDAKVEYYRDGTVTIMPPTDPETGKRVLKICQRLANWSDEQGKGSAVGPDSGFRFPEGSRFSPDASWFNEARWQAARKSGQSFPPFAPEFVIELRSPTDRLKPLDEKMREYLDNGVQLGWLIDPKLRTVTIYRQGREPEVLSNPTKVVGEGPVEGFVLSLERII